MSLYTLDTSRTSEQGFVNTNHNPANMNRNIAHYTSSTRHQFPYLCLTIKHMERDLMTLSSLGGDFDIVISEKGIFITSLVSV